MGSFLLLLQPILLLLFVQGVGAFVYSCEEVKYKLINTNSAPNTQYACVITEEGYANTKQLDNISVHVDKDAKSFADIASSGFPCMENKEGKSNWNIVAESGFTLNCDQEFTLILSSDYPIFIKPKKEKTTFSITNNGGSKTRVVVVPQGGMVLKTIDNRNTVMGGYDFLKIWAGAGNGESEQRYGLREWKAPLVPEWIFTFNNVVTITASDYAKFTFEISTDLDDFVTVSSASNIAIISSGQSSDLQNLDGSDHRARINVENSDDSEVTAKMQLTFDSRNDGSVVLQKSSNGKLNSYRDGSHTEKFTSHQFEIRWVPKPLQPSEISNNKDFINIDISLRVPSSEPVNDGPYCSCTLNSTGDPVNWQYSEIWLDIIVILDTSEAMTSGALKDAGRLVESLFTCNNYWLDAFTTEPSKIYTYSRVGVIAMSDTAEILYNLNMTKDDKIQGKVSIKKGVSEIDVIYAYTSAMNMFNDGLKTNPERAVVRQVIYYMTASNPANNLNPVNHFKETGVVIVNNFAKGGMDIPALRKLASEGYYFVENNCKVSLESFCKANCFCKKNLIIYEGSDPAVKASGGCYDSQLKALPFHDADYDGCFGGVGGSIASIHDEDKEKFINGLMSKSKSDYFWIGYFKKDDGLWEWTDGMGTQVYTNWDQDEPQQNDVARCAYVTMDKRGEVNNPWGAGNCNVAFPYVCQYPPCSVKQSDC